MCAYGTVNLQEVFWHPVAGWQTSEIPFYGRRLNIIISAASPTTSPYRVWVVGWSLSVIRWELRGSRECGTVMASSSITFIIRQCQYFALRVVVGAIHVWAGGVPGNMVVNGVVSRGKLSGNKRENWATGSGGGGGFDDCGLVDVAVHDRECDFNGHEEIRRSKWKGEEVS